MTASTEVEIPRLEVNLTEKQAQSAVGPRSRFVWLRRLYVPLVSLLLTVLIGDWLAARTVRDLELKTAERTVHETVTPMPGLSSADLEQARSVLGGTDVQPKRTHLLYLGDSQVFSRPDAPPGSLNTPQWLQILLSRQDDRAVRVHVGASPGMNIPEMLVKSVAATGEEPRQDDVIVADVMLAELRELGVRDEISALAGLPAANSALRSLITANTDLPDAGKALKALLGTTGHGAGEKPTSKPLAAKLEDALEHRAEGWSFFAQREALVREGLLRYAQWEHRLLHITSDKRISTPAVPYRTNLQLLELMVRFARSREIHVVLFFGPVRNLEPNPDAPDDLARMRRDVTDLCQRYGVTCLDYSHAIPEGFWADYAINQRGAFAMLAGQHDFYHFTEAGHKALAEQFVSDAGPKLLQWSNQAGGQQ